MTKICGALRAIKTLICGEEMDDKASKADTARIHYLYWIGILIFSLIYISCKTFTPEPNFTEYLGNVATGISLVVGVIAIFYSFISNNSLSASLGNISSVSESLKLSESKIENVLDQSKILVGNHDKNLETMRAMSEHVQSSVMTLSNTLTQISNKTDELQQTVVTVPTRLESIADLIEKKQQTTPSPQISQASVTFSKAQAREFNRKSSVPGNLLTYGCALAKQHNKEFSLEVFNKLIERNYPNRLAGFLDCMSAAGLIKLDEVKGKENVWNIAAIDEEIAKDVKPYFVGFLDRSWADDAERLARYRGVLQALETFFATPSAPDAA